MSTDPEWEQSKLEILDFIRHKQMHLDKAIERGKLIDQQGNDSVIQRHFLARLQIAIATGIKPPEGTWGADYARVESVQSARTKMMNRKLAKRAERKLETCPYDTDKHEPWHVRDRLRAKLKAKRAAEQAAKTS